MRLPQVWLVFDEIDDGTTVLGSGPVFICGRAQWHDDATLIVTVSGKRRMETVVMDGKNPNQVARTLLRELHRTTAR